MSFMKMKNYLYLSIDDQNGLNINVSHREILRIRERFDSDKHSEYKIVYLINNDGDDEDDLYQSDHGRRYFQIVKK